MALMVRTYFLTLLAAVSLAFAATPVTAQAQPLLLNIHDVSDDGYTYVGNPTNFGYVLLNDNGASNTHKNGQLRITQNGVLLYETMGMSNAHDYDALNPVFFAFPRAGPYEVSSGVPASAALNINNTFTGVVHEATNMVKARIDPDEIPGSAAVNEATKFVFSVATEAGTLLEHSDALFEVRRSSDNWLVFRTHLHSHTEAMGLNYAFPEAGDYTVRIVGYQAFPGKNELSFEPVTYTKEVTATLEPPINVPDSSSREAEPRGTEDAESPYLLVLTTDPPGSAGGPPTVGAFGNVRLNALVFDTTAKALVPHVNFEASIVSGTGVERFSSIALHEYDGHLEVVDQESTPGTYTYEVTAMKGEWKETKMVQFTVVPTAGANAPPGAGVTIVTATGLDNIKAGVPQKIEFLAATLAGTPHGHSEIEIQVLRGDQTGAPMLINKLHTHGDGKFGATITFPDAGDYTLIMDVNTVHADATPRYYFEEVGKAPVVGLKVAEGVDLPNVPFSGMVSDAETPEVKGESPLPLIIGVLAVGVAVFARRRQA
ncbi:MAG TPA: hypothetical protein VGB18_01505 [Candidatus Thermoplasmatota archaeon]